jgi:hypothetical protein
VRFLLGDLCLELESEPRDFLDAFAERWSDCIVPAPAAGVPTIRCSARALDGSSLLALTFAGNALTDPLAATGTPVRMLRHLARYAQQDGPAPGWRMLVDRDDPRRLLAAGDRSRLVIDLDEAPVEFAFDALIGIVQSAQRQVLFLHAASFGIGGAGALLIGAGQSGKSTTALALGARGHLVLGDDVAAIRTASRELLPFRKTLSLRSGPHLSPFEARLSAVRHTLVVDPRGATRTLVSIGALFPAARAQVLPLRFAFVLGGFASQPRLTAFQPGVSSVADLKGVVCESLPAWGLSPGRDLMRFLGVISVLSELDCHRIELGTPQATAATIEAVMETTCST